MPHAARPVALRPLATALVALALLVSLTGCGFGGTRPPPTLATATQKPFARVTFVDWANTTDAVRRDYLTRGLANYPGCPVMPDQVITSIYGIYSAEAESYPTPEQIFLSAVRGAGCQRRSP